MLGTFCQDWDVNLLLTGSLTKIDSLIDWCFTARQHKIENRKSIIDAQIAPSWSNHFHKIFILS